MNKEQANSMSPAELGQHQAKVRQAKEARLKNKIMSIDLKKIQESDLVAVDHPSYSKYKKYLAKELRVDPNFLVRVIVEERKVYQGLGYAGKKEYVLGEVIFVYGPSKNLDRYPVKHDYLYWGNVSEYVKKRYSIDTKNSRPCLRMIKDAVKKAQQEQ